MDSQTSVNHISLARGSTLVSVLLLFLAFQSHGQPAGSTVKLLPNDPGLVIWGEHSVLEDSRGFLWFATPSGLYRYDGNEFKRYHHGPGPKTLPILEMPDCLLEDRAGILWVTSPLGLDRLEPRTGQYRRYSHDPSDSTSIADNSIHAMLEARDGRFWVATRKGLDLFDRRTGVFTHIRRAPGKQSLLDTQDVSNMLEDRSGTIWLAHWGYGLEAYDPYRGTFRHYCHVPSDTNSLSNDVVHSLCETSDGALWIGTWGEGLDRLDRARARFRHFRQTPGSGEGLSDNTVTSLLQSRDGTLWVGTWNAGLNWSEGADGVFHSNSQGPFRGDGFSPHNITALCEDSGGILWVGSWGGIRAVDTRRARIVFLIPPSRAPGEGTPGVITSFLQDRQGRIWIGTLGGLTFLDPSKKTHKHIRHLPGDVSNPTESWIFSLCEDKAGDIWIGGLGGVYSVPKGGAGFRHYHHNPADSTSLSLGEGRAVYVDRGGTLWVGGGDGTLNEFDRQKGNFRHHRRRQAVSGTPAGSPITAICEDKSGTLWTGTYWDGLDVYHRTSGTFEAHVHDSTNPSSLSANWIVALFEDSRGEVWVRTLGGDLDRFNRETGAFEHIARGHTCLIDGWWGLREDRWGRLWFSSSRGIVALDPKSRTEQTYSLPAEADLNSVQNLLEMDASGDDRMILPTVRGLVAVYPENTTQESWVPHVAITGLRVSGNAINLDSALSVNAQEVRLSYAENALSFDFAVLDYVDPQHNQYACMLTGVDEDWVNAGTRRYTSYSNLDPGKYIFRVKGSGHGGVWNEAGASVTILIAPPWWRTTWASVLAGLLLAIALFGAWRLQVRRIKTRHALEMATFEAAKLHEVDELKSRFFANISHEFRTPLTLILGPVRQAIDESPDARTRERLGVVRKNATRLLDLVNQLLDLSRLESGNMKLQAAQANIVPFLKGLAQGFCTHAERKRIAFNFIAAVEELAVFFDGDKLQKIVTNILANAFKFTPAGGRIELAVNQEQEYVAIRISDTGIGIPTDKIPRIFDRFYQVDSGHTREQEGTGIGLSLTRELIELHRGTIEVVSEEGRGSTFTIRLPLGSAHLKSDEIYEPEEGPKGSDKAKGTTRGEGVVTLARDAKQSERPPVEVRGNHFDIAEHPVLLFVEDNADVRAYVRSDLEAGYRVLEAVDGQDGWDKAIEQIPDIIVSDIMMPRLDGLELCRRFKTDERTSHIPVILLTARAESQDKIAGFETGADEYIMKPFEPAELKARLANLLEQRKRLHEHFRKHGLFEVDAGRITSVDQKFLERLLGVISGHVSDPSFGVETLAYEMAMSKSLLLRKVEALVGEPPIAVIRRARLEKAAGLLEAGFGNIAQVALEVGFSNPSYFAECFRKQFGVNPSEYHSGSFHSS